MGSQSRVCSCCMVRAPSMVQCRAPTAFFITRADGFANVRFTHTLLGMDRGGGIVSDD